MKSYAVFFDYYTEIVTLDEEPTDCQVIVDILIDRLEEEYSQDSPIFIPWENRIEEGGEIYPDEYIIGGNHDLLLYTGGNFRVEPLNPKDPLYTTHDGDNPRTQKLSEWENWFEEHGDKSEYDDFEEWILDMINTGLLVPEKESFFE